MRDAVKLAQAMLQGAGSPSLDSEDGTWGPKTEQAWLGASQSIREMIEEDVLRHESTSVTAIRAKASANKARSATPAKPRVPTSPKVKPSGDLSGWRKVIADAAVAVGFNEDTTRAIIAQVFRESSGRLQVVESPLYNIGFVRRNLTKMSKFTDSEVLRLQREDPARFFNEAYAGKNGNGNVESGDGFRYRGRGPFQLTTKDNYVQVGKLLGVDLKNDPDWVVRTEANAVASVFAFLQINGRLGRRMSREQVAKLVNPGLREA